jgi:thiamine biosynthesis lipoprotein ApbE
VHLRSISVAKACGLLLLAVVVSAPSVARTATTDFYSFSHDGLLGTSVDLTFAAPSLSAAATAERAALDEIERMRRILSGYDSTSELSRLRSTGRDPVASPELIAVLQQYADWESRSGHAFSSRVGVLTSLWADAERRGRAPDSASLACAVASIRQPAWRIDSALHAVTALTSQPIDLNSLGKGFIVGRAVAAARAAVPSLRGGMIDIGGDVFVWGDAPSKGDGAWRIAVMNPRDHADNAPALTRLHIAEGAVSSSGVYARGYTIAGRHYSHIIDARTGQPADSVIGVTVIAHDNATANALATSVSALGPREGMLLVRETPGAEALLVTSDGHEIRSPGFAAYEIRDAHTAIAASRATVQATMSIDVTPRDYMRRRPYVAAWVTDAAGKHVRTLAMWGDRYKYQRDLRTWWQLVGSDGAVVDAVTRATRNAGQYTLEWDGLDQSGAPAPPGTYGFWLEAAFQNGPHSLRVVKVACGATRSTATIEGTDAFAGGQVACFSAR